MSSNSFGSIFQYNAAYVEDMFSRYVVNPDSVAQEWRTYFEAFQEGFATAAALADPSSQQFQQILKNLDQSNKQNNSSNTSSPSSAIPVNSQILAFEFKVARLVRAWKQLGHLKAKTNPLKTEDKIVVGLLPETYELSDEELNQTTYAGMTAGFEPMTVTQLIQKLEFRYASDIGAEIEHIENIEEREWLHNEFAKIHDTIDKLTQKNIYTELAKADALEKTLATKYIGKKRFSIEGADAQYPAIESFLDESANLGTEECTIAIAHRGRLNLLVNAIGKPLEKFLAEWEGYPHDQLYGDGDVKYHNGYESERQTRSGKNIRVSMPFNPSHLEYVDPVVMGETRARQALYYNNDRSKVASLVLHGDAAISGQGIVFETAQMMSLNGYSVGGTVHIVANNQIGFTTYPKDSRSSTYCTDVAKVTNSPIFHINSDNLDTLHNLMLLAARYRNKFKKDFYIDLVCFRRYGHNETDEPTFTQPVLYKLIKEKHAAYDCYAKYLTNKNTFSEEELKQIYLQFRSNMNAVFDKVKKEHLPIEQFKQVREAGKLLLASENDILKEIKTNIPTETIKELAKKISTIPENFQVNQKLSRIIVSERKEMAEGKKPIDWGMAELLAYATLLNEGYSVRLSGEDVQRGTFSHRHVTLIDAENASSYTSLTNCTNNNSQVEIVNSLLSEEAVLGFEYGYATKHVNTLTIWEAQFGDFVNGAQVIIDQFIVSGESKWCQTQGLVMFLPHGMEGQGAEHSSARLERFLQQCAQGNMQVCYFTTAAQIYHALRRQLLRNFRKPLVIMTPKSYLRSHRACASIEELSKGQFQEILDDNRIQNKEKVTRVLICTGKTAHDLFDALEKENFKTHSETCAIIRIEQLYPFHSEMAVKILSQYSSTKFISWVQEEPANMGAWNYIKSELENAIKNSGIKKSLKYIGRSKRATPAVGLEKQHIKEHEKLIHSSFESTVSVEI